MHIPGFDIEFPDDMGKVVENHANSKSKRSVACIATGIRGGHLGNQPETDRLIKIIDEQAGSLLDIFVRNGVRVICLESMEGRDGRIDAMGPSITAVLRNRSIDPFGVDNLALECKMFDVLNHVAASSTQYKLLFLTFSRILLQVISQHASTMMAQFITLRERYSQGQANLYEVGSELYQFSKALKIHVPNDALRALIALSCLYEFNDKDANQEQIELLERLKKNAEAGVFDPEMMTTFKRTALEVSSRDELNEYFQVDFSPVRLKGYELRALNYSRALLGLGGLPIAFSGSIDDSQVWQSAYHARQARYAGSKESLEMFQSVEQFERMYNIAHILGIDIQSYPQLCRYAESSHMLLEFGGRDYLAQVLQTIEQTWSFFEIHIPQTQQDRHLMRLMICFRLLRKLSLLQLVPSEYDYLIEHMDDSSLGKMVETLSNLGIRVDRETMREVTQFDQKRDFILSFYDNARQRANSMAIRTLEHMDKVNANQAVLICLGFHLPTIKSVWSGQNVSYSIILPFKSES